MITTLVMQMAKIVEEGVMRKADYIVTITWDDSVDCDVDLWIRDPNGAIVSFKNKSAGLMALERDDLGFAGDTEQTLRNMLDQITSGVTKPREPDQYNEETIVLRGTVPGTYTMSVFLYSCRVIENGQAVKVKRNAPFALDVEMKLMRINPYKIMKTKVVSFNKMTEELPIIEFDIDEKKQASRFADSSVRIIRLEELVE
jgi:hypothetical protein